MEAAVVRMLSWLIHHDAASCRVPESHGSLLPVAVCGTTSRLIHTTVSPGATTNCAGSNSKSRIATTCRCAGTGSCWTRRPSKPPTPASSSAPGTMPGTKRFTYAGLRIRHGSYCATPSTATNLPLAEALKADVLLVHTVNGQPLPVEHTGPCRIITPQLYAWKGAKWISKIEVLERDQAGFWEQRGYSNTAYPWRNDRYSR